LKYIELMKSFQYKSRTIPKKQYSKIWKNGIIICRKKSWIEKSKPIEILTLYHRNKKYSIDNY